MQVQCFGFQVLTREGVAGMVRASFHIDSLVTLADVTLVVDEGAGTADFGGEVPASLTFHSPLARKTFAGMLAVAAGNYAAQCATANQLGERIESMKRTIEGMACGVNAAARTVVN
jgi:hypothetical protein